MVYRIGVHLHDVLKLGVAFPTEPNQPQLIAFPITLPMMGWTNSLPIFCAATETTIADLVANEGILKWRSPPHHTLWMIMPPHPCSISATSVSPRRQCRDTSSNCRSISAAPPTSICSP
jgi:hypothetical protein